MSLIVVMSKPCDDDKALENVINYIVKAMEEGSTLSASSKDCICHGVNLLTP